jgi:hypothetical protein
MDAHLAVEVTTRTQKLLTLCGIEGIDYEKLVAGEFFDSIFPGICMTDGCDHTCEVEGDQTEGYCEMCGGQTVVSALILAGVM